MPSTKQQQPLAHTGQGSQSLTIDSQDFVKGVSTSTAFGEQGFSPASFNINLLSSVGQISSTAAAVNTNNNSSFVATCSNVDVSTPTGYTVRAIDSAGKFWSGAATGIWTYSTTQDSMNTYTSQFSDMVSFYGNYYASANNASNGNISQWDGAFALAVDWFHTNFGSHYLNVNVPHPMLVFNKNLYIADGNMLHKFDGISSYSYAQLTIDTDAVISALAIDPNSGRMMVSFNQARSVSEVPAKSNVGLYDGTNPTQFLKIVPMDDIVRCLYSVGGNVYMGYGSSLGIWNGAGVTFLRQLPITAGFTLHKQVITNIGNDIYFYDGSGYSWCYTEIQGLGKKVFNRVFKDPTGQTTTALFSVDAISLVGFSNIDGALVGYVYYIDVNAVGNAAQSAEFHSNRYSFPRPVFIRAADLSMAAPLTGVNDIVTPVIVDDNSISNPSLPVSIDSTIPTQTNRIDFGSIRTTSIRFILTMATSVPFKRIIIYYDPAE